MPSSVDSVSNVNEVAECPYSFLFLKIEHKNGGYFLEGAIRNISSQTWEDECQIGLNHFVGPNGPGPHDVGIRASLRPKGTRPGEVSRFYRWIEAKELPQGAMFCHVDLVLDGVKWFGQGQPWTPKLELPHGTQTGDGTEPLDLLAFAKDRVSESDYQRIKLLEEVIAKYNFSEYDPIRKIARFFSDRSTYKALLPSPSTIDEAVTRTPFALWDYLLLATGRNLTSDRSSVYKSVAPKLVKSAGKLLGGVCPTPPAEILAWMNQRLFPASVCNSSVTRSMMALLKHDQAIFPHLRERDAEIEWAFITGSMIEHNLPSVLIPSHILQKLTKPSDGTISDADLFPPVSRFMDILHKDNSNYSHLYDLGTAAGRCGFAFDLAILGLENEPLRQLLGPAVLNWLLCPIGGDGSASAIELLLTAYVRAAPDFKLRVMPGPPQTADILRRYIDWLPRPEPKTTGYPIRVLGLPDSPSGLGTNMRMTLSALDALGLATKAVDVTSSLIAKQDPTKVRCGLKRPIDIFHMNLDDVPRLVARYSDRDRPDTYRIGFALWETSVLPQDHIPGAELMDELWVPSRYLERVFREAGFDNVHYVGKGIDAALIDRANADKKMRHTADNFTFLMAFEVDSWVERKNPMAAVKAFQIAFPKDDDIRLLIKTNRLAFDHPGDKTQQVERLVEAAENDHRIDIIAGVLPLNEYYALIGSADATVSPHCAEGFGYFPAYSLISGVPAIVTNYSGVTDFCDKTTSFPVNYSLVELRPGDFVHTSPGAAWAVVDIEDLAAQLRQVKEDYDDALRRAKRGSEKLRREFSMEALSRRYSARFSTICQQSSSSCDGRPARSDLHSGVRLCDEPAPSIEDGALIVDGPQRLELPFPAGGDGVGVDAPEEGLRDLVALAADGGLEVDEGPEGVASGATC